MNKNALNKTYLADYQPPEISVDSMTLNFELFEQKTRVTNRMKVHRHGQNDALRLDGHSFTLVSLTVDDNPSNYQADDSGVVIHDLPETFELEIVTELCPEENDTLMGLYHTKGMYCTQCEAEGFRRITYFWDRPDVLTRYTTRISADKARYPVLLSNGNCIDQGEEAQGRHWAVWEDPSQKPCYLFALVAGDLGVIRDSFRTMHGRDIALSLYCNHGKESRCYHAMASLKKAMAWDEQVYGREYDLDQFMIVVVDAFNMGAMENKGLNIFNDQCILADQATATDSDFEAIEGVVAHEYFHNWTGNRVTCRDWFQLSLKEGLTVFRDQEFSRDMNSRNVNRIKDVIILRRLQFPEDAGPLAHPVQPKAYVEINNFYTSTIYEKGAELIRMQHTLLGKEGFRKGMDLYFQRHDGQAVTIDDFVAAMSDANQVDMSQFKHWYDQAGTPEVTVTSERDNDKLLLHFQQQGGSVPLAQPLVIPIEMAIFDHTGKRCWGVQSCFILDKLEQTVTIEHAPASPVISLLRGFSAPVKLNFSQPLSVLAQLVRFEDDGFAQYEAMQAIQDQLILAIYDRQPHQEILSAYIDCIRHLLAKDMDDPALTALLITPPNFELASQGMTDLRIHEFLAAIDTVMLEVKQALSPLLSQHYQNLANAGEDTDAGQRHLKNILLSYLVHQDEHESYSQSQFDSAQNMTDYLAAFQALVNKPQPVSQQACQVFFERWQDYPLVIDKWFATQAVSRRSGTWQRVKALCNEKHFDIKNPNRIRALIGSFCRRNPTHFHHAEIYAWAGELIKTFDAINPMVSASMVTIFSQWRMYSEDYRQAIMGVLDDLSSQTGLSAGCREMVERVRSNEAG